MTCLASPDTSRTILGILFTAPVRKDGTDILISSGQIGGDVLFQLRAWPHGRDWKLRLLTLSHEPEMKDGLITKKTIDVEVFSGTGSGATPLAAFEDALIRSTTDSVAFGTLEDYRRAMQAALLVGHKVFRRTELLRVRRWKAGVDRDLHRSHDDDFEFLFRLPGIEASRTVKNLTREILSLYRPAGGCLITDGGVSATNPLVSPAVDVFRIDSPPTAHDIASATQILQTLRTHFADEVFAPQTIAAALEILNA